MPPVPGGRRRWGSVCSLKSGFPWDAPRRQGIVSCVESVTIQRLPPPEILLCVALPLPDGNVFCARPDIAHAPGCEADEAVEPVMVGSRRTGRPFVHDASQGGRLDPHLGVGDVLGQQVVLLAMGGEWSAVRKDSEAPGRSRRSGVARGWHARPDARAGRALVAEPGSPWPEYSPAAIALRWATPPGGGFMGWRGSGGQGVGGLGPRLWVLRNSRATLAGVRFFSSTS